MRNGPEEIRVTDSHTEGELTRVIVAGGPELGDISLSQRVCCFHEPRGSHAVVGALICEPTDPAHAAGVIFFNNVGYLGMCGHGTIGASQLRSRI
jgi:4-hydroxyproline epimerase